MLAGAELQAREALAVYADSTAPPTHMKIYPVFVVGAALFFMGVALLGTQLARNGGWSKARQFRVLGELWRGVHGRGARTAVFVSFALLPTGACLLFSGVAASDAERARRCEARCAASGYRTGSIGPNRDRDPDDRSTWFVACICEGGAGAQGGQLEINANSLMQD